MPTAIELHAALMSRSLLPAHSIVAQYVCHLPANRCTRVWRPHRHPCARPTLTLSTTSELQPELSHQAGVAVIYSAWLLLSYASYCPSIIRLLNDVLLMYDGNGSEVPAVVHPVGILL